MPKPPKSALLGMSALFTLAGLALLAFGLMGIFEGAPPERRDLVFAFLAYATGVVFIGIGVPGLAANR